MTVKWLNRSIVSGPHLCLVLTEADFHKAFDHLKQPKTDRPPWILNTHSSATCHTLSHPNGQLAAVVCFRGYEDEDGIAIAGLLLHEAVHTWQRFCEHIGETHPSLEFEAYSIQWIAQQLMWSFAEQTT